MTDIAMPGNSFGLLDGLEQDLRAVARPNTRAYKYYYQEKNVPDLGVSTPPKLRSLKELLGWPTMAVDVLLERINFEGYWSPRKEDQELVEALMTVYRQNHFEAEQKIHQKDAAITGAAYISVGTGDTDLGEPAVIWRSEAPTQVYGVWNDRTRRLGATIKLVEQGKMLKAVLTTPGEIYYAEREKRSKSWSVTGYEENELGYVPYVFIANNGDSQNPRGKTEITPAIRSLTDSGQRTLLGAETIREYFTQPLRAIAGLDPSAIMNPDGTQKKLWDLIAGGILNMPYNAMIEQMPQLQQLATNSPKEVMDQVESYGKLVAREIGVPPSYMGFETVNPSSAEAINEADKKLILKAKARIPVLARAYKQLAAMTLDILGYEGADISHIEAIFARPETPTPASMADWLSKFAALGGFERELPDFVYRDLNLPQAYVLQLKEWLRNNQATSFINQLMQQPGAVQPEPVGPPPALEA